MIWLKVLHISAIAIWSGVLLTLPALYVSRSRLRDGQSLHVLHGFVRFLYVAVMSPAAFVGIGTGTALIFWQATFEPWFSLKLAFVGLMAVGHILAGLVALRVFDEGETYPAWRGTLATFLSAGTIVMILVLVLAKPELPDLLPAEMAEPGALRPIVMDLIPSPRR